MKLSSVQIVYTFFFVPLYHFSIGNVYGFYINSYRNRLLFVFYIRLYICIYVSMYLCIYVCMYYQYWCEAISLIILFQEWNHWSKYISIFLCTFLLIGSSSYLCCINSFRNCHQCQLELRNQYITSITIAKWIPIKLYTTTFFLQICIKTHTHLHIFIYMYIYNYAYIYIVSYSNSNFKINNK